MTTELHLRYRPKRFKDVIGQEAAIKTLANMLKREAVPHALLLSGPPGVGKTTLARILKEKLNCHDMDCQEVNAADARGIDDIRRITTKVGIMPVDGGKRMCILDEAHKLTGDAQNCLLKVLEDCPKHFYFVLCTTDPTKLIRTVLSRCTEVKLNAIQPDDLERIVKATATAEGKEVSDAVSNRIVEAAMGCGRDSLKLLGSVIGLETEDEQLAAIVPPKSVKGAFDLVKALLWQRAKWPEIAKILTDVREEDAEGMRRLILKNATNEALKGGKSADRAVAIIDAFESHTYDCGFAGLVRAAFSVVSAR